MKQQTTLWIYPLVIIGVLFILISGCRKDNNDAAVPVTATSQVGSVSQTSAICGGNITSEGYPVVTNRGVCWSTSSGPAISDAHTADGNGYGIFTSRITGLYPNTTYYVRAYATNRTGTGYGVEVSFQTQPGGVGNVTDVDGNVYHTVTIGTQVWMMENLKATKFNDGNLIPLKDYTVWAGITSPAYCLYLDDPVNKDIYGVLYNWYCVSHGKLAPIGWHVPSETDWAVLTAFLGNDSNAGGKLKEAGLIHWKAFSSIVLGTNDVGFTALPGGYRDSTGLCLHAGFYGCWWSDEPAQNDGKVRYRTMNYDKISVNQLSDDKNNGLSVRCVRD